MRVTSSRPSLTRALARGGRAGALIEAMRPKQWTKNAVVFAPLVFDGKLFSITDYARVTAAAILFCMTTGAIYLLNDLMDAEADRHHPYKRLRPIASGRLSPGLATRAIAVLAILAAVLGFALSPWLALVLAAYSAIMLAYTFSLKHLVLIDVFIIAAGFILRAAAGAVVIHVPMSPWLYVCTLLLSLFIGFAKRRHELVLLEHTAGAHRRNLEAYSAQLLDELIAVVAAATIMAYSLYTFSAPNLPANHAMMLTIPFVLYGVFRYLYLVHKENGGGAPEQMLLDDVPLLISILLWASTVVVILYLS